MRIFLCALLFLVSVTAFGQKTPRAKLRKPVVGESAEPAAPPVLTLPKLGAAAGEGPVISSPTEAPVALPTPAPDSTDGAISTTEPTGDVVVDPSIAPIANDSGVGTQPVLTMTPSEQREVGRHIPVLISYLPVDLIIPSKLGLTIGYAPDTSQSYEVEAVRGSLTTPWLIADLGGITDTRVTLLKRKRVGRGNFFVSYGLSYMDLDANLGSKYLNQVPGAPASVHILRVESLGAHVGIGHRWDVWKGLLVGVDWVDYTQPLIVTRRETLFLDYAYNDKARDDIQTAMKWITYFPRLTFLKLQLGWQF